MIVKGGGDNSIYVEGNSGGSSETPATLESQQKEQQHTQIGGSHGDYSKLIPDTDRVQIKW